MPDLGADIADLARDSVVVRDEGGTIRLWNTASEHLYGFSKGEALGRNIDALLRTTHPFGLSVVQEQLLRTGAWTGEIYRICADGRRIRLAMRQRLRSGGDDAPSVVIEWAHDPGQEEAAKREAELASHRYRNLFHAMAASFWELDFSEVRQAMGGLAASGVTDLHTYFRDNPDFIDRAIRATRVVDVNDKTLEMFGASSRDELLCDDLDWVWPAKSRHVYAESLLAAAQRKDSFITETTLLARDGRRVETLFTVCWPPDHKGAGNVLVGVIDVTEHRKAQARSRESEHRYRDLFQHMPIALLQLNMKPLFERLAELRAEGVDDLAAYVETNESFIEEVLQLPQIEEANIASLRLFGVETGDQLKGSIAWGWKESPETVRRSLVARLRGLPSYSEETRLNTPDGRVVDVLYTMSFPAELIERGINVAGFIDITERKRADAALKATETKLQTVQADFAHAARVSTLGELAASIAHEVNQPLAAISAYGQASLRWLARPEPDLEELASLAGMMVDDAMRASEIIARIRGMALKRDPEPAVLDMKEVVDEALLIVRHELLAHGVEVRALLDAALPPVHGDRVQLQQVLVNLAINAVQAMATAPAGKRVLTLAGSVNGDRQVEIAVCDNGPGIPPEHLDRLFEGFFSTKQNGMGMGLPICRSIIEAHGGIINAASGAAGASFVFTLPQAETPLASIRMEV